MRALVLALALLAIGQAEAAPLPATASTPGFLPVEQAFPLQISWQEEGALLTWRTPPGYALYKQRLALQIDPHHWHSGTWQIQGQLETDAGAEPAFQERYIGPLLIFIPLVRMEADEGWPGFWKNVPNSDLTYCFI